MKGIKIYSKKSKRYNKVELLVWDNLLAGIYIENSLYRLREFDLTRVEVGDFYQEKASFPATEIDKFIDSLSEEIKEYIDTDLIFDIDFNQRTYYVFFDIEDGNYLAMDKNKSVYSLVHEARPAVKKMKVSLLEILIDINSGRFGKERHLEERYGDTK